MPMEIPATRDFSTIYELQHDSGPIIGSIVR